ncbi:hypothetical protein [Euzebya sp.]|uniref:hypothetical protein n=1 Tax=Euzebya sp. TaxID=1971409 RepID=UPI0035164567
MTTLVTPGANVRWGNAPAQPAESTAIDTTFLPIVAERGPVDTPVALVDIVGYRDTFGDRAVGFEMSYDVVEALTRGTRGRRVVAIRVPGGPAHATAEVTLDDGEGEPAAAVTITAAWPGAAGNRLTVDVVAGSSADLRTLVVTSDDVEVQRVIDFDGAGDLVDQLESSTWVRGTLDGEADAIPAVVADQDLAGGDDDLDNLTLTEVEAALELLDESWGRGQLIAPLWTSTAAHELLLEQAAKDGRNRVAYLDAPLVTTFDDTVHTTWAGLRDAVSEHLVDGVDISRLGLPFPVWHNLQPYGTGDGIPRRVPGSVFAAAVTATADQTNTPSTMPIAERGYPADAGTNGVFREPVLTITAQQRTALTADHINVPAYDQQLGARLYGFRSVSADPMWRQGNWARYGMSLQARLDARAERFVGGHITRDTLAELKNNAALELTADYEAGDIFGDTVDDAFTVDVGDTVNPADEIAAGRMRGRAEVTMTPAGETVIFDLLARPIA